MRLASAGTMPGGGDWHGPGHPRILNGAVVCLSQLSYLESPWSECHFPGSSERPIAFSVGRRGLGLSSHGVSRDRRRQYQRPNPPLQQAGLSNRHPKQFLR